MAGNVRQHKVAAMIQEELSDVMKKTGLEMLEGGMVTISEVTMSPDLLVAKIYFTFYNIKDKEKILNEISEQTAQIRGELGNRIRNAVRRVPELIFYIDDSVDRMMRIDELLRQIKK